MTTRQYILRCIGAILALSGNLLHADPALHDAADHRTHLKTVEQASRSEFDRVVSWYDARIQERPFDIRAATERCAFIESVAATFEYMEGVDEIHEQGEDCGSQLRERYGNHPEVELHELAKLYGEELQERSDELIARLVPESWTRGQAARLYTKLAQSFQLTDKKKAGRFAELALQADLGADVYLIAAEQLVADGEYARALELLTSPFDPTDNSQYYYSSRKMQLLTQIGARRQALDIYEQMKAAHAQYDATTAAKALREMGAIAQARSELAAAASTPWNSEIIARERFVLEYEMGTPAQALDAYNALRDLGYATDPLGVNRMALLTREATLPLKPRDLLGLFTAGGLVVAAAALMLIPVSLVHYRGLARRARAGEPPPSGDGWNLRHAWWVLTAYVAFTQVLVLYAAGPVDLTLEGTGGWWYGALEPEQIARMGLWAAFLVLLAFAIIARLNPTQDACWVRDWTFAKAVAVGLGTGLALRIPALLSTAVPGAETRLLQDPVMQMLVSVKDHYGVVAAFWVMAMAAPVIEEFLFRRVLLQSFARHIAFGWANIVQAALFAAAHLNLRAAPFLFVFALIAGTYARRSGGLLAPIIMHATVNAIVGFIVLA
jgi:membrane protease YdiL (CAAX protease family)